MQNPFSIRSEISIKKRIFLLLIIVFISFLLLETHVFYNWFQKRKDMEMQANLELARAVAIHFETFLQGLIRDEQTLGLALTASRPIADEDRDRMLNKLADDNPSIRGINWVNPAGVVIASSLRSLIGINLSDRFYFKEIVQGGGWAVSELVPGRFTGEPTFVVSSAVRAQNGELLGVVAAAIEPDNLNNVLGVHRSVNAGVSLIDNKGMHVSRFPPTEYTWEQRNWLKLYPVLEESLKGREITAVVTSGVTNQKRFAAFVPVYSVGWVAGSSRAEDDVTAAIFQVLMPQAVLTLLLTLSAFAAAVALSRPITRSIDRMKGHAAALGRGKMTQIAPDGPQELKTLAYTLNEMAEKIQLREATIRESRAKLEAALASMTDAVCISDARGRFIDFNDAFAAFHRIKNKEACAKNFAEYPDILDVYMNSGEVAPPDMWPVPRALRGETFTNAEYTFRRKDSGETWIGSCSFAPIHDKEGAIVGSVVVCRDITESKRAQQALRESEQKYRSLFEHIEEAVTVYEVKRDASGRIVERRLRDANRAFLRAAGVSSIDEIRGKTTQEIFGKVWSNEQLPAVQKTMDTGVVQVTEIFRPRSSRYYVTSLARLDAQTLMGTGWDITERKRSEEALRESEQRFRQLADAMPQFVWTAKPDGQVDYCNERYREFDGIKQSTDGRYKLRTLLHPEDLGPTATEWKKAVQSGQMYQIEHRVRVLNGEYHWHLSRAVPIRDSEDHVTKWFGTSTDIGSLKQAEQELRHLNENLEKKVRERTAMAEERAIQLRTLAVELIESEEKERVQFAHLLHDDLQQMLAAAKMEVQSVADCLPGQPMLSHAARLLEDAIEKSRRLSHDLSPAILHQAGLVAALKWLGRRMKEQFGLGIEMDLSTELLMERTPQKVFLFRAVQELLFNIIKHAGIKRAKVELTSSEDLITVTVSDPGCGFDPEVLEERKGKSGFGLLTIKERASYIGGTLSIESAPRQGSRFTLTVPKAAAKGHEEAPADLSVAEEAPRKPKRSKSGASPTRVLFIDDHHVMRQGLIKLVKGQPTIQVVGQGSNGREALELALKLSPDVIVMDISMPEMDGIEATRRIKAELPSVRIVGLTMHNDPQLIASMQNAGAEVTLSKTVSATEMVKAIYGSSN